MKKLFSIVLMAALLVTCITPALYSSAADLPSFAVAENTEYDENAGTVDVSFGIADNPGISEMTVLVYYIADEMSFSKVTNGDYFSSEVGASGESTSNKFKKYFQAPEFEEGVVYQVTEVSLYSSTDGDEANNGSIFNVTFDLVGNHAAGTEFTYGVKLKEAVNANGDEITFAAKQEGKVTSIPDPYKELYNNFTVFVPETTVDSKANEVTVELRLVNNPGISAIRVFVVYDAAMTMTKFEAVDGIFKGSEFEIAQDMKMDPNSENASPSLTNAINNMKLSTEGKAAAQIFALADPQENRTNGGVLARMTFTLPEGMQQNDSFPIDFCWAATDVIQLDMEHLDEYGQPSLVYPELDRPTSYIKTETCEHPNLVLEVVKEATCTETGLKSGVCPDCGQTIEEIIPMIPHVAADEKVIIAPTCTEAGKIQTVCSVCNQVIDTVEDTEHPALGHDEENATVKVIKEATCTEKGSQQIICGRCGEVIRTEEIEKLPHTEKEVIIEPTCTEAGRIQVVCTVCDTVISDEEDPDHPALGHKDGKVVITKPATCQEEGSQDVYCERCEEKLRTEVIPKLDHTYVTETVDPTCVDAGRIITKCSVCGEVFSDEVDAEHPATGIHTPGEPIIVEPTATEEGSKTIKCTVCGQVISEEKIPAKGVDTTVPPQNETTKAPSNDVTTKTPTNNSNKTPVTGDNMVYVIIVAAVAVIGCTAVVVIRRRKASGK